MMIKKSIRIFVLLCSFLVLSISNASANQQKSDSQMKQITIAMLHLELKYSDLAHNYALIEKGIRLAAQNGAQWIMTPELALTAYRFDLKLGTDWIPEGPDQYVQSVQTLAKEMGISVFLSHLEREGKIEGKSQIFNTLFVIDKAGQIIAKHRKINTIPVAEAWSTKGLAPVMLDLEGHKVGLLICADAWPSKHAKALKDQGAELLLSSASWAPGEYGPGDTWEKRSKETQLPLFVSNRTGIEREFDLRKSASVVSVNGKRVLTHTSPDSQIVIIKWNQATKSIINSQIIKL